LRLLFLRNKIVFVVTLIASLLSANHAFAQQPKNSAKEYSPAIEDNSFLIEEAYNQEVGVVQHISNAQYFSTPQKDLLYSFTQEWPLFSQTHQLSFTIPYSFLNSSTVNGIGDVLVNYRYQLFTSDDWAAVAPRFSVILPTGNVDKGLSSGVTGVQTNIAASKRLSELFIIHVNAGLTLLPNVKGTDQSGAEVKRTLTNYNLGASVIMLAAAHYNFMLEFVTNFSSKMDDDGNVARSTETIINPGLRYAIDVGELQIVPGIALPISFSNGDSWLGMFFYLSFEHPF
jgi:hypothetical protein